MNLILGSQGPLVRALQKALNQQDYYQGVIDGSFGLQTLLAVQNFQQKNNLTVDGLVGLKTQQTLFSGVAPLATPKIPGLDVSHWQSNVIWDQVPKNYASFVYVKATEGAQGIDPYFSDNWQKVKTAGFIRGAYHFLRPLEDVSKQIDLFCKTVNWQKGDLRPALDIEWATDDQGKNQWSVLSLTERIQIIQTWIQTIAGKCGANPVIYTNQIFWNSTFAGNNPFANCPLWLARYKSSLVEADIPTGWANWTFWQYKISQPGEVPGVGSIDMDQFNGTEEALRRLCL